MIHATNSEKPLHRLSPFAIHKGIQGLAGTPVSARKLRSGDILVEVSSRSHAMNLLRSTMLVDTPIYVDRHKTLNTKKGVVRCRDLLDCTEEEIVENLKMLQCLEEVRKYEK